MMNYEEVVAYVNELCLGKEAMALRRGTGATVAKVNDLLDKLDSVIDNINKQVGCNVRLTLAEQALNTIRDFEKVAHDPFHTMIDIDHRVRSHLIAGLDMCKECFPSEGIAIE